MTIEPTPEALEAAKAAYADYLALLRAGYSGNMTLLYKTFALALDDFARQARDRALEEAALKLECRAIGFRGLGGVSGSPIMNAKLMAEELVARAKSIRALKSKESQT